MKYLVSCIVIGLLFLFAVGCNGVKHVISIEEPTDHTSGDDGGKLKYKVIFGDVNQKERYVKIYYVFFRNEHRNSNRICCVSLFFYG